jgi:hypothetical protein
MIKLCTDFLNEKLGYREEVSLLTDFIWKKFKEGERKIDCREFAKNNLSFEIDTIYLDIIKDSQSDAAMSIYYDDEEYKLNKSALIDINIHYHPTIMCLEHEIKHLFDFIINNADYLRTKKAFIPFQNFQKNDKLINIITVSYIVQTDEIGAYLHSDIRNYKKNKNKYKTVKKFVMHSSTYYNYKFLIDTDIRNDISSLTFQEKLEFMHVYDKLMHIIKYIEKKDFFSKLKSKIKELLKVKDYEDKQYSEQQVDAFFNKFIKDIEIKKKLLLKNLGRLYTIITEYNNNL